VDRDKPDVLGVVQWYGAMATNSNSTSPQQTATPKDMGMNHREQFPTRAGTGDANGARPVGYRLFLLMVEGSPVLQWRPRGVVAK